MVLYVIHGPPPVFPILGAVNRLFVLGLVFVRCTLWSVAQPQQRSAPSLALRLGSGARGAECDHHRGRAAPLATFKKTVDS